MKNTSYPLLFPSLALGLAWAVRGHFGHEWGAAWAGGIGTLAVILISGREDWQFRAPVLGSLGAIGWAIGGMMSYGMVIGYCRGTGLGNVWYGYSMLAMIGGLYGFLGGGFVGLGLSETENRKVAWASLITQMVAGAYLFWGFFIFQLEWFMTPPRSELWAACLGAAVAMAWFMYREGYTKAARVAIYTGLGAGFGFAFGNFLQTAGAASGISYNWWNVMEFSLGAFGGLGMAYGIKKQDWPETFRVSKPSNFGGLAFLLLFIPLINFSEAFSSKKLGRLAESFEIESMGNFVLQQRLLGIGIALITVLFVFRLWKRSNNASQKAAGVFFALSSLYVLWSYLIKGVFLGNWGLGHSTSTYVPILLLLAGLWYFSAAESGYQKIAEKAQSVRTDWLFIALLLGCLIFALISLSLHDGLPGAQIRFSSN
ncbi:MAG: hypothetical protein KTR30_07680 [Saprospiraceae bacterium]|nr:hypothetical protein [Saprospiraceae bacterium]